MNMTKSVQFKLGRSGMIAVLILSLMPMHSAEAFPGAGLARCIALSRQLDRLANSLAVCRQVDHPIVWGWDGPIDPCASIEQEIDALINTMLTAGCIALPKEPEVASALGRETAGRKAVVSQ